MIDRTKPSTWNPTMHRLDSTCVLVRLGWLLGGTSQTVVHAGLLQHVLNVFADVSTAILKIVPRTGYITAIEKAHKCAGICMAAECAEPTCLFTTSYHEHQATQSLPQALTQLYT